MEHYKSTYEGAEVDAAIAAALAINATLSSALTPINNQLATIGSNLDQLLAGESTTGKYITTAGTLEDDEDWSVTDFIAVPSGATIEWKYGDGMGVTNPAHCFGFYNSSKTKVDYSSSNNAEGKKTFSPGGYNANTAFVRASFMNSASDAWVKINGKFAWRRNSITDDVDGIKGELAENEKKVDKLATFQSVTPTMHSGGYVSVNGKIASVSGFSYSEPIEIQAGTFISFIGSGASSVAAISIYWDGTYYEPLLMYTNSNKQTITYFIKKDCSIVLSSVTANFSNARTIHADSLKEIAVNSLNTDFFNVNDVTPSSIAYNDGYYINKNGVKVDSIYYQTSSPIDIKRGDVIFVNGRGTAAASALAKYEDDVYSPLLIYSDISPYESLYFIAPEDCQVVHSTIISAKKGIVILRSEALQKQIKFLEDKFDGYYHYRLSSNDSLNRVIREMYIKIKSDEISLADIDSIMIYFPQYTSSGKYFIKLFKRVAEDDINASIIIDPIDATNKIYRAKGTYFDACLVFDWADIEETGKFLQTNFTLNNNVLDINYSPSIKAELLKIDENIERAVQTLNITVDTHTQQIANVSSKADSSANTLNGNIAKSNLSKALQDEIASAGGGTISNNPDDDDLESATVNGNSVIRFKSSSTKKIILRVDIGNVLTSSSFPLGNCEYILKYDFTLDGGSISLPENVTLIFDGGSIDNGTLVGNGTRIVNNGSVIFGTSLSFGGSFVCEAVYEWFYNPADIAISQTSITVANKYQLDVKTATGTDQTSNIISVFTRMNNAFKGLYFLGRYCLASIVSLQMHLEGIKIHGGEFHAMYYNVGGFQFLDWHDIEVYDMKILGLYYDFDYTQVAQMTYDEFSANYQNMGFGGAALTLTALSAKTDANYNSKAIVRNIYSNSAANGVYVGRWQSTIEGYNQYLPVRDVIVHDCVSENMIWHAFATTGCKDVRIHHCIGRNCYIGMLCDISHCSSGVTLDHCFGERVSEPVKMPAGTRYEGLYYRSDNNIVDSCTFLAGNLFAGYASSQGIDLSTRGCKFINNIVHYEDRYTPLILFYINVQNNTHAELSGNTFFGIKSLTSLLRIQTSSDREEPSNDITIDISIHDNHIGVSEDYSRSVKLIDVAGTNSGNTGKLTVNVDFSKNEICTPISQFVSDIQSVYAMNVIFSHNKLMFVPDSTFTTAWSAFKAAYLEDCNYIVNSSNKLTKLQ